MLRRILLILLFTGLIAGLSAANRFWVAAIPGNWSDQANWSATSGGAGGASVPGSVDLAMFDLNGPGDCTLDIEVDVRKLELKAGFIGTIRHFDHPLTVGDQLFKLYAGTFEGGSAKIISVAELLLDGATFLSTSDTLFINKKLTLQSGSFDHNDGTVEFNAPGDNIFKNNISPTSKLFNAVIDLGDGRRIDIDTGDTLWVENRIDLYNGKLDKSALVVEDTAYVHLGWDQGNSEIIFMDSGTSHYILDNATWSTNDVFVQKDSPADSVIVKDFDDDGFLKLGQSDKSIEIRIGTLAFEKKVTADFDFQDITINLDGTLVGTNDTLTISGDYINLGGEFIHNQGTICFDGTQDSDFICANKPTDRFFNVDIEKSPSKKVIVQLTDTLWVENRLQLGSGLLPQAYVVVEDTAYCTSNWEGGSAELIFAGLGNSYYLLDNGTWSDNNVVINKDLNTDTTIIEDFDNDSYLTLGQNDVNLEVRIGTLAIEPGVHADFDYLELKNNPLGTIVASNDTLSFSGNYTNLGGVLIHNSGTFIFDGNNDATFRSDNVPTDVFYDVIFEKGHDRKFNITLGDTLHSSNDLWLINGEARVGVWKTDGDVEIAETYDGGSASLMFAGSIDQSLKMNDTYDNFEADITIDKQGSSDVHLHSDLKMKVDGQILHLLNGNLVTTVDSILIFDSKPSWTGASALSYVSGPMLKEDKDPFEFPVGREGFYAPIAISDPGDGKAYRAEYFHDNVDPLHDLDLKAITLDHVSNIEYWRLERTEGDKDIYVTLNWGIPRSGEITELKDISITGWDGSLWQDRGTDYTLPGLPPGSTGNITTPLLVTVFGEFTLSTHIPSNVLPVEYLYFNAEMHNGQVLLDWSTASEVNCEHFIVQRSQDALHWEEMDDLGCAGNSSSELYYSSIDIFPYAGTNYYRLKQVDFNGDFEYSDTRVVSYEDEIALESLQAYPNPSKGLFKLTGYSGALDQIRIFDIAGAEMTNRIEIRDLAANTSLIDISSLPEGMYMVWTKQEAIKVVFHH